MVIRWCTRLAPTLAITGVIACAPLAAWISGFVSTSKVDDIGADYMMRPLGWSTAARTTVGVLSLVIVATAALVVFLTRSKSTLIAPGVLAPLAAGSAFLGVTYHVVTAPVIGANIGGGLIVMLGVPMVAALVIIAVSQARTVS